jgi:hypothetical protein
LVPVLRGEDLIESEGAKTRASSENYLVDCHAGAVHGNGFAMGRMLIRTVGAVTSGGITIRTMGSYLNGMKQISYVGYRSPPEIIQQAIRSQPAIALLSVGNSRDTIRRSGGR